MAISPLLAPKYAAAQTASRADALGQMFVSSNHIDRRALETQPGEIPRKPAHQRLHKRQDHHQQARVHGVELRFDSRPHHIGKRNTKSAAQHQVWNNAQRRQKNSQAKEKNRQRKPFDAAQVRSDV